MCSDSVSAATFTTALSLNHTREVCLLPATERKTGRGGARLEGRRVQDAVKTCWCSSHTMQMKIAALWTAWSDLLRTDTLSGLWRKTEVNRGPPYAESSRTTYQHMTSLVCKQWKCEDNLRDNNSLKCNSTVCRRWWGKTLSIWSLHCFQLVYMSIKMD